VCGGPGFLVELGEKSFEPSAQCYCRCIRWCLGFGGYGVKLVFDFHDKFANLVSERGCTSFPSKIAL
jgi:hypothetical protein